jgi:hypothetical protein
MIQQTTGTGTWMERARTLPAEARIMGVYLLGASRTGKSRMLGRVIAWQDFVAEPCLGQVIFDPRGLTISNFLDKLIRFLQFVPPDQHDTYWRRIRYVDVSGKAGFITGLPLYYRLTPEETLAEISERYLQLVLKSSPHLDDAQILGWPPFHRFGLNAGMLCASLGLQITDIAKLISHPEQWLPRFAEAEARNPEAKPACDFFRNEFLPMRQAAKERLTNAFRDKLVQFTHDRLLSCQFGPSAPPIDWEEVEEDALTVLLDFSGETNTELRRFKMLWLFDYFFHWIKTRGRRSYPLALLIDEMASMTQKVFSGENPFAVEMAEFIQEYLRNSNILLTVAHQSIEQIDDQVRNSLLSLGTYIFGRPASLPEARALSEVLFFKRDPFLVKHMRKHVVFPPRLYGSPPLAPIIEEEPLFFPLEEQTELFVQHLTQLGLFQFLCRPATSEGAVSNDVFPLSIADIDRDEVTGDYQYPDLPRISEVRSLLAAQCGVPIKTLLAEQDALRAAAQQPAQIPVGGHIGQQETRQQGTDPRGVPASQSPPDQPRVRHQRRYWRS